MLVLKTTFRTSGRVAKPLSTLLLVLETTAHSYVNAAEPLFALVLVLKSTFRTCGRVAKPLSTLVLVLQIHFPHLY